MTDNQNRSLPEKEKEEEHVRRAERVWQKQTEVLHKRPRPADISSWADLNAFMEGIVLNFRRLLGRRSARH